ncbi:MAG: hypothetical protein OXF40_10515 [Rhodospirillales bacterium]|nr:hypothetical protein [Rhodospirillales bacterium]
MSPIFGSDPAALPLWTAVIGLAAFIYGFGSGERRNGNFRVLANLIGLAGTAVLIAGIAGLDPALPSGI